MTCDYDKIRADNIKEYGEGERHLSLLGNRLYSDRTHFVFELLQNAEDAGATRILFSLFKDRLEVTHDGRPFNEHDVKGVCGVGEGTKSGDLTQIGRFGIGFKSVYAYTSTPEIHSGDESFRIENYVRPYLAVQRFHNDLFTTLFVFPFNTDGIDPEIACQEIGSRLRKLSARTLLFLRHINMIEYSLPNLEKGACFRDQVSQYHARQVTVTGRSNSENVEESWLIFERLVTVPNSGSQVPVEVGFRLETIKKEMTKQIVRAKDTPLVVYFPTEKETRLGFLIQGPYRTTLARDNIPKDDDWNKILIAETCELVVESLRHLKMMGFLTVSLLETLPIKMEDFPKDGMFYPIAAAVQEALKIEQFLPTDDGTFVAAQYAKLAGVAELRNLLSRDQLRTFFHSHSEIKWLSGAITSNRTPDLWNYLRDELDVKVIDSDGFARKITSTFLQKQTDEWMISLYKFFATHQFLWRLKSNELGRKPFIRLQDGTHVEPFPYNGSTKAYLSDNVYVRTSLPIVKVDLSQDKEVYKFFKDLGVPELDIVAEVVESILPKYANGSSKVPVDEHKLDLNRIEGAYSTDSQKKKKKLNEMLRNTPFILAKNQIAGKTTYSKPEKIYFYSDELQVYFSGNESFAYVSPEYNDSISKLFEELGVVYSVRVDKKKSDKKRYVSIRYCHGDHIRGHNDFDPDIHVDGLEFAINNPSPEKSEFIWNNIAIPNSACIRGVVEKSTRQDFGNSTTEDRKSEFGRLLFDSEWLPNSEGSMHKPGDLSLDDLPKSFIRDERLAHQLNMNSSAISELAEKADVDADDIKFMKEHREEWKRFREKIASKNGKPEFPKRKSNNPGRRRKKINKKISDAPKKKYQKKTQSTRTTKYSIDSQNWLREFYTNRNGEVVCQICHKVMPFRKRDGKHYFEAVEIIDNIDIELEELHIALCPLCAAMYKEFIKNDENSIERVKDLIIDSDDPEISIQLGEIAPTLRFVETHFYDLKHILKKIGMNGELQEIKKRTDCELPN